MIQQICSVLAGYVWDLENPYVKNHDTYLKRMVRLITVGKKLKDLEEAEGNENWTDVIFLCYPRYNFYSKNIVLRT